MDLGRSQRLIENLEGDLAKVPGYDYVHLQNVIACSMDEAYRLARSGEYDEREMRPVALEQRTRLVLERFRREDAS